MLRNRFAILEDEDLAASPYVMDQHICDKIFFIGKRSIFKAESARKLKLRTSFCDEVKFERMIEASR